MLNACLKKKADLPVVRDGAGGPLGSLLLSALAPATYKRQPMAAAPGPSELTPPNRDKIGEIPFPIVWGLTLWDCTLTACFRQQQGHSCKGV